MTVARPEIVIVGAGLAGLAAALTCAKAGKRVQMIEATNHAGGRCRTYHDPHLDCAVDNGNHFLLSANHDALDYVSEIGADHELTDANRPPVFPFLNVRTGVRWTVRPNMGPVPWWIFDKDRRAPGTTALDHLRAARIVGAKPHQTVADIFSENDPLFETLWEPFSLAVMNTPTERASAALLKRALILTFGKGGAACRLRISKRGLGPTLVDPALARLRDMGADMRFGVRVAALERTNEGGVRALRFADGDALEVAPETQILLAAPTGIVEDLAADVTTPEGAAPIANVHFRFERRLAQEGAPELLGVIGGTAQWIVLRDDIASVTVSAAFDLDKTPKDELVRRVWADVAKALNLSEEAPPPDRARVVRERRATFLQTPANEGRRPRPGRHRGNLHIAGDWTRTGLPACIDGAVKSGRLAAADMLRPV